MDFGIEQKISNFIESQFPQFYLDEGQDFVLFVKAYYEWMESEGKPVAEARKLLDYRDIDNTLTDFLEHFQKKYLYGIPFNIIINKRFLLKHILDVYRSKGTIQCYKLLFKLIYNQDIDVYLPGIDMLRLSDGTWKQPYYLEVTDNNNLQALVGKTVVGAASGTTAVVESHIREAVNGNIVNILYLSNISPSPEYFKQGEKVVIFGDITAQSIEAAPTIVGSFTKMEILNGGTGFKVGDIFKLAHKEPSNNQIISYGSEGEVRVRTVGKNYGAINFVITNGGNGYSTSSQRFVYNANGDADGQGSSFNIGSISYAQILSLNTDVIYDYRNTVINATSFGFTFNPTANVSSTIQSVLTYTTDIVGSIASLTDINTGNSYSLPPVTFVKSLIHSNTAANGTVSYSSASNTVTGTGTLFTTFYSTNGAIYLQANSSDLSTGEYVVIKSIANNTSLTLYGPPSKNSTASAISKLALDVMTSNFATYDPQYHTPDNSISGENAIISGIPNSSNTAVLEVDVYNSGKSYLDGEVVKGFLFNGLDPMVIVDGGTNYANNENLIIAGGDPSAAAAGYVITNSSGVITNVIYTFTGSGYNQIPFVTVKSINGSGAILKASIQPVGTFNTSSYIQGRIRKGGSGKKPGYWSTTKGFLNSDKYIQDSYFYQDFSYQIKAANILNKYKDILYKTFHVAGTALFGEFLSVDNKLELSAVNFESMTLASSPFTVYIESSNDLDIKVDNSSITTDKLYATI